MRDDEDRPHFVGFYWTFPVKWAGFTRLSDDAEEAARQSRTIRYQRALAHRHVRENRGVLVDELVFLERSPDRGTEAVEKKLARGRKHCVDGKATLLWVNFAESHGWRPHPLLHRSLHDLGMRNEPLQPVPWLIGDEIFEPAKHFRNWARLSEIDRTRRQTEIPLALAAALDRVPAGYGRNVRVAQYLNESGVLTKTGLRWTPDTVAKAVKDVLSSEGDEVPRSFDGA
jgi:hypothetical protein